MKKFSIKWNKSTQVRKQRKYRFNAPKHIKSKFLSAHLSKELKQKHGIRSIRARKGDTVKIVRGQFKGKSGKIDNVNLNKESLFITGIDETKKDGSKRMLPIRASKVIITDLSFEDKKRKKRLERKSQSKINMPNKEEIKPATKPVKLVKPAVKK